LHLFHKKKLANTHQPIHTEQLGERWTGRAASRYCCTMTISRSELERRLVDADRVRNQLRRATRDLMRMGDWIRERRKHDVAEPRRPDQPGTADG
jgi:hypothetical protein